MGHRELPEFYGLARCMGGALGKHDIMVKHLAAAGAGTVRGMQEVLDGGPTESTMQERREDGNVYKSPGTRYWSGQISDHTKRSKGIESNPKLHLQSQISVCMGHLNDTHLFTTSMQARPLNGSVDKLAVDQVFEKCLWKFYEKPLKKVIEKHL